MAGAITNDDLFVLIQNGNKTITEKIDGVKQEINVVKTQLNGKIASLEKRVEELETENRDLKIRQVNIEKKLKKNNLVFYGIEENPHELFEDTLKKVHDIILSKQKINLDINEISNCFRLGKHKNKRRPILVEFVSAIKRREILYKSKELRGTKVFVNEDLTVEDRQARKILLNKLKEAKAQNRTAILKGNKLIVDGTIYTHTDFMPDKLNLTNEEINCMTPPPNRAAHSEPSTPSYTLEQSGSTDNIRQNIEPTKQKPTKNPLEKQISTLEPEKRRKLDQTPRKDTDDMPKKSAAYQTRFRNNSNK